MNEEQIIEILKPIQDPELGASIVDLGLIYGAKFDSGKVKVTMTFTTPLCPFGDELVRQVREKLEEKNIIEVEVDVTFDPAWGLDKIKPELREMFMFPSDI